MHQGPKSQKNLDYGPSMQVGKFLHLVQRPEAYHENVDWYQGPEAHLHEMLIIIESRSLPLPCHQKDNKC